MSKQWSRQLIILVINHSSVDSYSIIIDCMHHLQQQLKGKKCLAEVQSPRLNWSPFINEHSSCHCERSKIIWWTTWLVWNSKAVSQTEDSVWGANKRAGSVCNGWAAAVTIAPSCWSEMHDMTPASLARKHLGTQCKRRLRATVNCEIWT